MGAVQAGHKSLDIFGKIVFSQMLVEGLYIVVLFLFKILPDNGNEMISFSNMLFIDKPF